MLMTQKNVNKHSPIHDMSLSKWHEKCAELEINLSQKNPKGLAGTVFPTAPAKGFLRRKGPSPPPPPPSPSPANQLVNSPLPLPPPSHSYIVANEMLYFIENIKMKE